jgi:glutathionylspermidine synthase
MVCLTELIKEGKKLFYMNDGKKTEVKRIYNRIIFDDLQQQTSEVQEKGKIIFEELDVEWCPHPNWFYRISKFTLPFIRHPYVPQTFFLNEVKQMPTDLENYVLKPLFSFAGQGVVIDVTQADIDKVKDPQNWILQRKVKYAEVIQTPDVPAKAEIRVFYFWKEGDARPVATNNLGRLSKGKMIGVRYNKDKEWVGGSFCYFEK